MYPLCCFLAGLSQHMYLLIQHMYLLLLVYYDLINASLEYIGAKGAAVVGSLLALATTVRVAFPRLAIIVIVDKLVILIMGIVRI